MNRRISFNISMNVPNETTTKAIEEVKTLGWDTLLLLRFIILNHSKIVSQISFYDTKQGMIFKRSCDSSFSGIEKDLGEVTEAV